MEDDAEAEPEIAMGIVGGVAQAAAAKTAQAVAVGVGGAGGGVSLWRMKEIPLFGAEEEEVAVDEAEELLEVVFFGQGSVLEALPEEGVFGVGEEAAAEGEEGFLHAKPQPIADAEALGVAFGFPFLPDGIRWRGFWLARAGDVEEPPEGGEVGIAVGGFAEDGLEVEFEEVGTGQGFCIPEEAEGAAIGDDGPEAFPGGVEVFLGELVGGFFPGAGAVDGEAGIRVIQAKGVGGDDDGEATAEGLGGDGEAAVADGDGAALRGEVGVTQGIAQEIENEGLGGGGGVQVGAGDLGGEVLPEGGGDAEGAAVLIVEFEAFGDGVVGFLLGRGLAPGGALEQLGHEEGAFEPEGVERGGVGGFAAAGHSGKDEV